MAIEIKKDSRFINVIGTVDTQTAAGRILYVNPTKVGTLGTENQNATEVELVVEDAAGQEMFRMSPVIRRNACDPNATAGLIQQDVPYKPGMHRLRLLLNGSEVDTYEAPPSPDIHTGKLPPLEGLAVDPHSTPQIRSLRSPNSQPEPGVTYNILAQPEGEQSWHAIRVGATTADAKLDRNQFPGISRVKVRVVRSTGFDEEIVAEGDIDIDVS